MLPTGVPFTQTQTCHLSHKIQLCRPRVTNDNRIKFDLSVRHDNFLTYDSLPHRIMFGGVELKTICSDPHGANGVALREPRYIRNKRFDYKHTCFRQVLRYILKTTHLHFLRLQRKKGVEDYVD